MPEGPNLQDTEKPLTTELEIKLRREKLYPDKKIINLNFGNSGLSLIFDPWFVQGNSLWQMHFTPESSSRAREGYGSKIKYSRMFASAFIAMIDTLLRKINSDQELAKVIANNPIKEVTFNTNDTMWNFARKIIGEKYFVKIPQDFSNVSPEVAKPIRRIMDEKGWPGDFLLADFLADYSSNPSILDECIKIADSKKLEKIRIKG